MAAEKMRESADKVMHQHGQIMVTCPLIERSRVRSSTNTKCNQPKDSTTSVTLRKASMAVGKPQ
jgi:hypothetical protein